MFHKSPTAPEETTNQFLSSHICAGNRAGERLYTYAHIQRARRQSSCAYQDALSEAQCFHPQISKLARSSHLKRAPLYPGTPQSKKTSESSTPDVKAGCFRASTAPARLTAAQWLGFLSRTAAYERRRASRLRDLKVQVADASVRECTFRPQLGELTPEVHSNSPDKPPSVYEVSVAGKAPALQWGESLNIFMREMEMLKRELERLTH